MLHLREVSDCLFSTNKVTDTMRKLDSVITAVEMFYHHKETHHCSELINDW